MRIEVTTDRLEAALQKVRQLHPIRGKRLDPPTKTILEEVRERLRACNRERLADLAYSFDASRLLACLEILVTERDEEVADKACHVLMVRPRDNVIRAGWFKLILHYPHDLLEKVIRANLEASGFAALSGLENVSERVHLWFVSERVSQGILRDYEGSGGHKNLDTYLEGNFLNRKDGMFKEVWRLLLLQGGATSLQKEDVDRVLLEYRKPENATYLAQFCQRYLNVLQSSAKWDERILRFIEKKYGEPSDPDKNEIETPFWKNVKPEPKKEFRTWIMLQRIQEFFEGERADFWRRYVVEKRVTRVKKILDGDGFMIDFGPFGVVEFKNLGNAAYIYPANAFGTYWRRADRESYVSRFKDKEKTISNRHYRGWDGRIIHREGWQSETSSKIKTLMKND